MATIVRRNIAATIRQRNVVNVNDPEAVRDALFRYADITVDDEDAVKDITFLLTKILPSPYADLSVRDDDGNTPLHYAASGESPICTGHFIDRGANVNARNNDDRTPLHLLADIPFPDMEVYRKLHAAGADVNAPEVDRYTPLHCAALNGSHQLIRQMLADGANPNAEDRFGRRVLELAQVKFDEAQRNRDNNLQADLQATIALLQPVTRVPGELDQAVATAISPGRNAGRDFSSAA